MKNEIIIMNPSNHVVFNTGDLGAPIAHVYRIFRRSTGKSYIGSTTDWDKRSKQHLRELINGTHIEELQKDYNSNPRDFFIELLDEVFFDEIAEDIENHHIKKFGGLTFGNVYNSNKPKAKKAKELSPEEMFKKSMDEFLATDPDKAIEKLLEGLSAAHAAKAKMSHPTVQAQPPAVQQQATQSTITPKKSKKSRSKIVFNGKATTFNQLLKLEEAYFEAARKSKDTPEFVIIADHHINGKSWGEIAKELKKDVNIGLKHGKKKVQAQWDTLQNTFPAFYIANGGGIIQGDRFKRCVTNLQEIGINDIPA